MFLKTFHFCVRKLSYIKMENNKYDVSIIGGGIIGTAIARKFKLECKNLKICLLEKECTLGRHQSSHNSGVMHCGIYYKPNSLKAKHCVEGINLLKMYCDEKKIPYNKSGKLIVATDSCEVKILHSLLEQGLSNNVKGLLLLKSHREIQKYGPGCRGKQALWCPETSNVNFKEVTEQLGRDFEQSGGKLFLNTKVLDIHESEDCNYPIHINVSDHPPLYSKYLITCGGLHSELLTRMLIKSCDADEQFLFLKVNYHQIDAKYCENLQINIYRVPDLELPFLGSHFSPQMDGSVLLGPSAVPALKLEGYCNDEISLSYLSKIAFSCTFHKMIVRNFSKCVSQVSQTLNSDIQIKFLQQLVPNFSYQFVKNGHTAVQCHLLNSNGTFVDDFVFDFFNGNGIKKRIINMKHTPSPAATSCLSIANNVYENFSGMFYM